MKHSQISIAIFLAIITSPAAIAQQARLPPNGTSSLIGPPPPAFIDPPTTRSGTEMPLCSTLKTADMRSGDRCLQPDGCVRIHRERTDEAGNVVVEDIVSLVCQRGR